MPVSRGVLKLRFNQDHGKRSTLLRMYIVCTCMQVALCVPWRVVSRSTMLSHLQRREG